MSEKKAGKSNNIEPRKNTAVTVSGNYPAWLESLKKRIQTARAALSVNAVEEVENIKN